MWLWEGHTPSVLAFGVSTGPLSPPRKPSFPGVRDTPPTTPDQCCLPRSIHLSFRHAPPPPLDPAFSQKGSVGLTPTQAIMMNNGFMWVFTGDSIAASMEEFRPETCEQR